MDKFIEIDSRGRPQPRTMPGLYPIYYLVQEWGSAYNSIAEFCVDCVPKYLGADDVVIAAVVNWEDPALHCESCGRRIESAYAED